MHSRFSALQVVAVHVLIASLGCSLGVSAGALAQQERSSMQLQLPRRHLHQAVGPESDFYSKLITIPSNLYGEVKKTSPMPRERYDDQLFNHTAFQEWLLQETVLKERPTQPAPMAYRCGVFVNHAYKLIFIRNRKAASTTVLDTFKVACKQHNKLLCVKPFSAGELGKRNLTHDKMWMDYYVISSTRNPWARAASGFDYTQDRWPVKTGVCASPSFKQFCLDPNYMGKISNLFRCGTLNSFRGDDAWAYDFYHVEPAHHCTVDAEGGLLVDFLIRYEHLQEDFMQLIGVLNKRRDPSLPEIQAQKMRWMKQGVHVQAAKDVAGGSVEDAAALIAADRHAAKYRACGKACTDGIAEYFKRDLEVMKIKLPAGEP